MHVLHIPKLKNQMSYAQREYCHKLGTKYKHADVLEQGLIMMTYVYIKVEDINVLNSSVRKDYIYTKKRPMETTEPASKN